MMEQLTISITEILGISSSLACVISVVICGLWSIWFNRIKEGQKAEFQKQIEDLKAKNEKISYISKTQFDAEFKMYQELSELSFLMILDNSMLFPKGIDYVPENKEDCLSLFEKRYKMSVDSLIKYQNALYKYAPFISIKLYEKFENIRIEAQKQINWYPDFRLGREKDPEILKELISENTSCWKRTKILDDLHKELIIEIREYLEKLMVHED